MLLLPHSAVFDERGCLYCDTLQRAGWSFSDEWNNLRGGGKYGAPMVRGALLSIVCLVTLAVGCSGPPNDAVESSDITVSAPPSPSPESQIYSAVLVRLVLEDHTFGSGPSPFEAVYVLDRTASRGSGLYQQIDGAPFGDPLEAEVIDQSDGLPTVEFIAEAGERADPGRRGMTGVDNNGVIVSLSDIAHRGDGTAEVGAGYWCGIDCGYGTTYVVGEIAGRWEVLDNAGPITIS